MTDHSRSRWLIYLSGILCVYIKLIPDNISEDIIKNTHGEKNKKDACVCVRERAYIYIHI